MERAPIASIVFWHRRAFFFTQQQQAAINEQRRLAELSNQVGDAIKLLPRY